MEDIEDLLIKFKEGEVDLETVKAALMELPYSDYGDVKIDNFREMRKGLPEAVFCPGKTEEQLKKVAENGDRFFTRATQENFETIRSVREDSKYYESGKIVVVGDVEQDVEGTVSVITGGSSDIDVADEAAVTLENMGYDVERIFDVGVAGIHRLLPFIKKIRDSDAVIVAAGMDGTLPGIVAGLVGAPVVGIPTSVGYGTAREGRSALETMLNSCSTGLAVVNIDNGYGAAAFVHHMLGDG
ncbi:MAG: nickel pincer cofactor biosynthesis protein LarB [Thermoplasmatota archaeon]